MLDLELEHCSAAATHANLQVMGIAPAREKFFVIDLQGQMCSLISVLRKKQIHIIFQPERV